MSMNFGRTVFSQLIGFLRDREFRRCVARYDGDVARRRNIRFIAYSTRFLILPWVQIPHRNRFLLALIKRPMILGMISGLYL
jgi:Domain of unknown function (DUF4372)